VEKSLGVRVPSSAELSINQKLCPFCSVHLRFFRTLLSFGCQIGGSIFTVFPGRRSIALLFRVHYLIVFLNRSRRIFLQLECPPGTKIEDAASVIVGRNRALTMLFFVHGLEHQTFRKRLSVDHRVEGFVPMRFRGAQILSNPEAGCDLLELLTEIHEQGQALFSKICSLQTSSVPWITKLAEWR
jgi:hypothetical protein